MTYSQNGENITLAMTSEEYMQLLHMLGVAIGAIHKGGDDRLFYTSLAFINRLNAGNSGFIPYKIPDRYREEIQ